MHLNKLQKCISLILINDLNTWKALLRPCDWWQLCHPSEHWGQGQGPVPLLAASTSRLGTVLEGLECLIRTWMSDNSCSRQDNSPEFKLCVLGCAATAAECANIQGWWKTGFAEVYMQFRCVLYTSLAASLVPSKLPQREKNLKTNQPIILFSYKFLIVLNSELLELRFKAQ